MSDDKAGNTQADETKTAQPFSEGDERDHGSKSPGMKQAPHDRADAVGDADKLHEMPKTTQRQE